MFSDVGFGCLFFIYVLICYLYSIILTIYYGGLQRKGT